MDMLNIFVLHRIVGGLKPGTLPHEESLWCQVLQAAEEAQSALPHAESRDSADVPTRQTQESKTR